MTLLTITYANSGSSDTQASGAGPTTALYGTGDATVNGGDPGTTIQLTASTDLSGVAANDVLYLGTSSGSRHLTRIASVDDANDRVTVDDSFSLGGGVNWAIGGKRATFENDTTNCDFLDGKRGWRFHFEAGSYTAATGTTPINLPTAGSATEGALEITGDGASTTDISWTETADLFVFGSNGHYRFSGLEITNTTSTWADALYSSGVSYLDLEYCKIKCAGACVYTSGYGSIIGCDLESTHYFGLRLGGRANFAVVGNDIHDCGNASGEGGVYIITTSGLCSLRFIGNVIRGSYDDGIRIETSGGNQNHVFANNVFHDNGGDGIYFAGTLVGTHRGAIFNNIFTSNGGYGVDVNSSGAGPTMCFWIANNAYGTGSFANSSGQINTGNGLEQTGEVTLDSGDPYTASGSDDYTLNDTVGADAKSVALGLGDWDIGAAQSGGWDIGAAQHEEAGAVPLDIEYLRSYEHTPRPNTLIRM